MEGRKTILLANDNELFLELKRALFRRGGLDFLIGQNGTEALAMIEMHEPDLVFLDLLMPKMDGDECCRRIRSNPKISHIPVVLVTQGESRRAIERCNQAGCDNIMRKTLNRHTLLETARRHMDVIERAASRMEARLRVRYGKHRNLLSGYSVNLSTGGLFLETLAPLPPNTLLDLEFFLLNDGSVGSVVRCEGRVAWINPPTAKEKPELPPGMGIQFLNLPLSEMAHIRSYIDRQHVTPFW